MTGFLRSLTVCDFCMGKPEQVGPIQPVGRGALGACSGCSTGMAAGAARHTLTADRKVLLFMLNNGGDFWRLQAYAWLTADAVNSDRLMDAFGDVYRRYERELNASQQVAA